MRPKNIREPVFPTGLLARLIGLPKRRLVKFLESPIYGIKASVAEGRGKGKRRLYSVDDMMTLAIAWRLYQTGLRPEVIAKVLKSGALRGVKKRFANEYLVPGAGAKLAPQIRSLRELQLVLWPSEGTIEVEAAQAQDVRKRVFRSGGDIHIITLGPLLTQVLDICQPQRLPGKGVGVIYIFEGAPMPAEAFQIGKERETIIVEPLDVPVPQRPAPQQPAHEPTAPQQEPVRELKHKEGE